MSREFRLQDPGEGIHEAEVLEIEVSQGDQVEEGDVLLTVETDKAATEIPSPYTGTVERVAVSPGDQIRVGDLLMSFSGEGDGEEQTPPEAEGGEDAEATSGETVGGKDADAQPREAGEADEAAPKGGREGPIPAAPSTRRLARELGVDLADVEPSGPGGRVLPGDVRAFAEGAGAETREEPARERPEAQAQEGRERRGPSFAEPYQPPDFSRWGEIERVPLRSVRRAIAREMARSWAQIPHVMHQDVADITELERFRADHAAEVEEAGGKLTLTILVLKAAVAALKDFPRFNASLDPDDESIVLKHYYHLGVAVATERGLLVPVIRDVDRKSVTELAVELVAIAERARRGESGREEMQGGTFSVTNVGAIGGTVFTPIIRHPEVAILGLARAGLQPVVEGGDIGGAKVTTRLRLPLCLAFDHRVNDGAEAAQFVNRMVERLQDPEALLLSV